MWLVAVAMCGRYERSVIRLTIDAQSAHNPEMRVPADSDPALLSIADRLDQMRRVSVRLYYF